MSCGVSLPGDKEDIEDGVSRCPDKLRDAIPPNQSGVGRVKPMINQDIEDGVSRFFLTLFKGGGVQTHNQKIVANS